MKRVLSIVKGIFCLLLVLLAGEIFLRLFPQMLPPQKQILLHNKSRKHKTIPDPDVGFIMQPNQRELIHTRDFTYLKETDSKGFFNTDPWPERADILFLGDSLIVGEGVGLDGQFSSLLGSRLTGKKIVNLGLPGAGAERQHHIYRKFGVALRPRWVVACLYLASDLTNDVHFHAWQKTEKQVNYNRFRLAFGRRPEVGPALRLIRVAKRSALYGLGQTFFQPQADAAGRARFRFPDGEEILFDQRKLRFLSQDVAPNDPRSVHLFESLRKLQTLVSDQEAKLLVVLIPSKEESFGVAPFSNLLSTADLVRQRLAEQRFHFLDLYPAIRHGGTFKSPYFRLDAHLNRYGNQIIADRLATALQD